MENIKTKQLVLLPRNPRTIDHKKFGMLQDSIREFPEMMTVRPIVINDKMEVLGGNMRVRAAISMGVKEMPVITVDWSEDKQRQFVIKDNVGYGDWDWDILANDWDPTDLQNWALDTWNPDLDPDDLGEDFDLADGDKAPFQSLTFQLADDQVEQIQKAIEQSKNLDEFKYIETMGNDNKNGNALYLIITQWAGRNK